MKKIVNNKPMYPMESTTLAKVEEQNLDRRTLINAIRYEKLSVTLEKILSLVKQFNIQVINKALVAKMSTTKDPSIATKKL